MRADEGVTPVYGPIRPSILTLRGVRYIDGEEPTATPEPEIEESEPEPPAPDDPDRPAKTALIAERQARKNAEAEAKRLRDELAATTKTAEEQAIDAAKREARAEVLTVANQKVLRAEIKAAATGRFADPADALAFIDLTSFEIGDDGEIDLEAVDNAVTTLLAKKPHLAAPAARFQGAGDGGAAQPPRPEPSIDEQITAAHAAGDWKAEMRLQNQKMPAQPV